MLIDLCEYIQSHAVTKICSLELSLATCKIPCINAAPIPSLQRLKHFLDKFLSSLGGPGRILETLIQQMKKSRAPPQVSWSLLRLAWWLHDATSPEELCQHTDLAIFDWEDYLQYKKEKREQTLSGGWSKTFKITKAYSIVEALAFTHCQEPITI